MDSAAVEPSRLRKALRGRGLWLAGAVVLVVAAALCWHWVFGKPKVSYATAAVERGDIESTVVAAGILQPVSYVDVGAQTSGKLKSLKVVKGDQVEGRPARGDRSGSGEHRAHLGQRDPLEHDLPARPEAGASSSPKRRWTGAST